MCMYMCKMIFHMYTYIYIFIYRYARPPPPPPKIYAYAFVDHGAWGARNTVMLKKFQNF